MNSYRKELEERLEAVEFELAIDDYFVRIGEVCEKEYEEACGKGEAGDMPEDMKQRLLQFVRTYHFPDAEDESIEITENSSEKQRRHFWARAIRRVAIVAAICFAMLTSLVTVQAFGIDVFGAIGRWTDSVFHFHSLNDDSIMLHEASDKDLAELLQIEAVAYGFPSGLTPTWLPESYRDIQIKTFENNQKKSINAFLSAPDSNIIIVQIDQLKNDIGNDSWFEIDPESVEELVVGEMVFYVYSNNNTWAGVWGSTSYSVEITDSRSKEELIQIIQSIGGA